MTADAFRRLALALPEVTEAAHMRHPDFRRNGKVFATLGYPDPGHGMAKLTPSQQAVCLREDPAAFSAARGAWGQQGSTLVQLAAVKVATLRPVLRLAWANLAPAPRPYSRPR